MFHTGKPRTGVGFQAAMAGLALLSLTALIVTAWILSDFRHEQETFARIAEHLPSGDKDEARELAGELRLHARLSLLLLINIFATAVALIMLVRAYLSSQQSLREVKVLAADVLASMDQGVLTTDENGVILSINPQGCQLLNTSQNGVGKELRQLPAEHALLDDICRDVLEHHTHVRDRDYTLTKNGHDRVLRAGCTLLRDAHQRQLGTVVHVRDVTEKVLIEQRLRRMERYMGLGSLAAGLQHEIKNPLSALSLHVQLLDEALSEQNASEEIREMFGVLHTEIARITSVLERFRDFASISRLQRSEADLSLMVAKLVRLIKPKANQQNIRIRVESEGFQGDSAMADVDSVRLEQVLLNLALNALEAMARGGMLTIRLFRLPGIVKIEIGDTGAGIPEDLCERIFDPYFTTRNTGTGMGLAISEKIVRQHDGAIDFSSSPSGTVFTISLPQGAEL